MTSACAIALPRPKKAAPQARAMRQWLDCHQRNAAWLQNYRHAWQECMRQVNDKRPKLRQTPLLGDCLETLMTQLDAEQESKNVDSAGNQSKPDRRFDALNTRYSHTEEKESAGASKRARFAETGNVSSIRRESNKSYEVADIAEAKRLPCKVNDYSLRHWSGTPQSEHQPVKTKPATLSVAKPHPESNHKMSVEPDIRNAERRMQWHENPLQRVRKTLEKSKFQISSSSTYAASGHATSPVHGEKGALLDKQLQSILQRPGVSHELLTRIISGRTAAATGERQSAPGRRQQQNAISTPGEAARTDRTLPQTSSHQNRHTRIAALAADQVPLEQYDRYSAPAETRQNHITSELFPPEQQDKHTARTQTRPDQAMSEQEPDKATHTAPRARHSMAQEDIKTVDYQLTEDLLSPATNPAQTEMDDVALAEQIKRILDEEARRYGIDI